MKRAQHTNAVLVASNNNNGSSSEEEDEEAESGKEEESRPGSDEEEAESGKEEESRPGSDSDSDSDGGGAEDTQQHEEGSDDDETEEEEEEPGSAAWTGDDVRKELSHLPFEDVLKLQSRVGTKAYKRVAYGAAGRPPSAAARKRLNKNRPTEVSAKKPVPFLRQVVAVKKATQRDPRFDDLSGEYKAAIFEKTYKFVHDIRQRETQELRRQLKKTKDKDRKEKIGFLLKRMANQERARQSQEQQRARELQHKREQRERANRGARPFFLKKGEQKKLRLAARFSELKESGKLDAFLSKKRKRNAGKDRRKLPGPPRRGKPAAQ
ncbi:ribosomal RNA processing protein 36 homolog isoform X2 [Syngnathoides biaculeatus]|uniref:ribosomal RNA processing protein 36 homolog isoform X2 n=1 Tax=Syngnathoides biaculeatus TaxID=300417 RepID=UPI002ADE7DD4|nr:ribosomal RNA processing protein 36 homolog isoform X2 [Syngnathoides biaculeatus]